MSTGYAVMEGIHLEFILPAHVITLQQFLSQRYVTSAQSQCSRQPLLATSTCAHSQSVPDKRYTGSYRQYWDILLDMCSLAVCARQTLHSQLQTVLEYTARHVLTRSLCPRNVTLATTDSTGIYCSTCAHWQSVPDKRYTRSYRQYWDILLDMCSLAVCARETLHSQLQTVLGYTARHVLTRSLCPTNVTLTVTDSTGIYCPGCGHSQSVHDKRYTRSYRQY
ncbi:hypothetical protein J6590_035835 [Homalodisca vitripennis]|nr:hypothetical protein J6590_035835 [Homalodisca vitripennis]